MTWRAGVPGRWLQDFEGFDTNTKLIARCSGAAVRRLTLCRKHGNTASCSLPDRVLRALQVDYAWEMQPGGTLRSVPWPPAEHAGVLS